MTPNKKPSHTPGPWEVAEQVITNSATVIVRGRNEADGSEIVSHVARLHDNWVCPEHGGSVEANARLIAAAPTMYAALKSAVYAWESSGLSGDELPPYAEKVRAAIARAEGA